jgi:hypothetical protein
MLKDSAAEFMWLGERLGTTELLWSFHGKYDEKTGKTLLDGEGREALRIDMEEIRSLAERLELPTSMGLVEKRLSDEESLPKTSDEFLLIKEVLEGELASKLFLFAPTGRASYWENDKLLSDKAKAAFPRAAAEMRGAGNAYAAALPDGAVYYSMRALEHALRALAAEVDKNFDVQSWGEIIDQIADQITEWSSNGVPGMNKPDKNAWLQFLSDAAKEFVFFKDGWRNYAMHAKVSYTDPQARRTLDHVADFIERLSERLAEQA